MIARSDYVGPLTKSAEAMFDRAERQVRRNVPKGTGDKSGSGRPASPAQLAVNELGLSRTVLRHWEDVGIVAFERSGGRLVIDEAALECLRTVAQLRRAGFTIKEIIWISDTLPPSVSDMRRALQARLDRIEDARRGSIARVRTAMRRSLGPKR